MHLIHIFLYTGLPAMDKTSETTVRNLNCTESKLNVSLFMIPWNCKLVSFFVKSLKKHINTKFKAEGLIHQSHSLWVTLIRIKHLPGEPEKYRRMQYAIVIKYSLDFFGNISIGNYEIDSYLTEYWIWKKFHCLF